MKIKLIVICFTIFLTGCSSSIKSFYDRAVVEDSVGDAVGTLSVTAARRVALVRLEGENRGKFCAEPPPDVSENISTTLDAVIKAKLAELPADVGVSIKDKLKVDAVVLAKRTALLDVYRTGTYSLCQLHLNGGTSDPVLMEQFNKLTQKVLDEMGKAKD